MMTQSQMHIQAVKKEVEEGRMIPTESISIKRLNLDNFQLTHKGGVTNVAELIQLKEQIDETLSGISEAIRILIDYHRDSPVRRWDNLEKSEDGYCVGLNLELFMPEESEAKELYPGCFMADNFVLAEKVIKKFEEQGGNTTGFEDISYRDTAMWSITSKSRANKLIRFINKEYINPVVNEILKTYNIKKVIFTETGVDFEYKN